MPQFEPTYFVSQLFWLLVAFALLYVLMQRLVIPRIGRVLDERAQRIARDLELASSVRQEADAVVETYEAALRQARGEAAAVLAATSQETAKISSERQAAFAAQLGAKVGAAEARVAEAREAAKSHVREIAAEVTRDIAAKLGVPTPPTGIGPAVDAAMREVAA